jgi:opacity protein-like surface antigen
VYDSITREGGNSPDIETDNDQFPVIGGGAQWKMAGEKVDFGFEGMFMLSWRADIAAFVAGGGGTAVAIDVDLLLVELFAGPYVSVFLGQNDRWRAYAAAGPQIEWVDYEQSGESLDDSDTGFGTGVYARGGLEYVVAPGLLVGIGVRWADLTVDLGSNLGDLELDGIQYLLTVTRGI